MAESIAAAVYCRISLAILGDTTKTDDQERQCREVCARRGWTVGEVYTDNSKSAWQRNRKRPGWDAMLDGIRAGRFGAIVSYWGDRIVRQPRDLEDLLDLREIRNLRFASVMGEYDFDNKDHRMMMRWEVARGCNESDTISQRKKNQYERWRREGRTKPGGPGGRVFGFETDGLTHRPGEIAVIRRAAAAVIAGQSMGSITRELAAEGVLTAGGKPMNQVNLRRILTYPRMAALMPDGVSPAAWEQVLERAQWEAVRAALALNVAFHTSGNGAQHLLSGIARCGLCGGTLWVGNNAGGRTYKCWHCGKVARNMKLLDAYVTGGVIGKLADPANEAAEIDVADGDAAEMQALEQRRREAVEIIENLADHPGQQLDVLGRALESFDRRLAELRARASDGGRARILDAHRGMTREEFEAEDLSVRRAIVAACFRVIVLPASSRGPGFRPADVRLEAHGSDRDDEGSARARGSS